MKRVRLAMLAAVVVTLTLGAGLIGSGEATAQPPACGVVTTNTTLTSDCTGGLFVAASNIAIDLNGFTVNGIEIFSQTNVTVRNGSVTNSTGFGIRIAGGGRHHLRNLEITNNVVDGIEISGSDLNKVQSNTIKGNGRIGLKVDSNSDRNLIRGNDVRDNAFSFLFGGIRVFGQNNVIVLNTAFGNDVFDLIDENVACDRNVWRHNTFGTAGGPGFSTANAACIN